MNKKLAIFYGYSGTQFNGMQYQTDPQVKTIQNQIVQTLYLHNFLKTNRFLDLTKKYKWSRAARTDKGVHALINGNSCIFTIPKQFLIEGQNGYQINKPKILALFQKLLPKFTFYSIFEVENNKFIMRQSVKSRVYCYMCPAKLFEKQTKDREEVLAKVNRLCQYFIGTRNYHNYSTGVKAKDPSAKRYMISMSCKTHEKYPDWVRFQIFGQSFIYHQIRKMIGIIVQIIHEQQPENFLQNTFFNNIIGILLTPAEGLYLKSLSFESYNKSHNAPQKILFDDVEEKMYKKQMELEDEIVETEDICGVYESWLEGIKNKEVQVEEKECTIMDIEE